MTHSVSSRDPSDTARAVFSALAEGRGSDVAALVHPESAAGFKRYAIQAALDEDERRAAELALEQDPGRIPRMMGAPTYSHQYGVSSVAELRELAAVELIARFAERETARRSSPRTSQADGLTANPIQTDRNVLGHVMESSDTAHVVSRCTRIVGGTETKYIETTTMKLLNGEWYSQDLPYFGSFGSGWQGYPPA